MEATATGSVPRFDALDPDLLEDPYPVYARLRQAAPVCRGGPGTWAVTRHREVDQLLRDRRLGHGFSATGTGDPLRRAFTMAGGQPDTALRNIVPRLSPTRHLQVRRLITRALPPAAIRRMSGRITAWLDSFLDSALQRGTFDALTDLALPLQTLVACDLIDAPESDRPEIVRRAIEVGRVFILVPYAPDGGPGSQEAAARWLREYAADLLARRRRQPGDDLLSRLVRLSDGGAALSDDEIIDNTVFVFFAGFETTVHVIAGGCAALLRHPSAWRDLRRDPSLAAAAVEEIMRYDPPIQWVGRLTSEPVEVGGRVIRAGRAVLLLIASANRDERVFLDADRLDPTRDPNPHLSFGAGVHTCLGAVLARTVGTMVYERLARRVATLAPAGEPVPRPHFNLRGYRHVPVAVTAA